MAKIEVFYVEGYAPIDGHGRWQQAPSAAPFREPFEDAELKPYGVEVLEQHPQLGNQQRRRVIPWGWIHEVRVEVV